MDSQRRSRNGLWRTIFGLFLLALGIFPSDSRLQIPRFQAPTMAEIYAKAKTVVDLSDEQLRRNYPEELADLVSDEKQEELNHILFQVGESVDRFFSDFPKTGAKERVRMERLGNSGIVEESNERSFNYLFELRRERNEFNVEEFRTDNNGRPLPRERLAGFSYLTSGYAASCIFFHPRFQPVSRFRYLGKQGSGPKAYVVAFAQKPEMGVSMSNFQVEGRPPEMLFLQGLAWIAPDTFQIVQLRTDLLAPRIDIGLTRQTSQIWFSEVRFVSPSQSFWLPREVIVTAESMGKKFRNRHRYTEYTLFVVESLDKLEAPRIKKLSRE
jgi:hypothetical protein